MLPPLDDQVLRDNPEFARLYSTLTNVVLNLDGTTKHDQEEKKRTAVRKVSLPHVWFEGPAVHAFHLAVSDMHMLRSSMSTASRMSSNASSHMPSLRPHRLSRGHP